MYTTFNWELGHPFSSNPRELRQSELAPMLLNIIILVRGYVNVGKTSFCKTFVQEATSKSGQTAKYSHTDNPYFYQQTYNTYSKMVQLKDGELWPHIHPDCKATLKSIYGEQKLNEVTLQVTLLDTSGFDVSVKSLPRAMLRDLNGAIFLVSIDPGDQGTKDTVTWCEQSQRVLIEHLFPTEDRLNSLNWETSFTTTLAGTKSDLGFNCPKYQEYCKFLANSSCGETQADTLIKYWKTVKTFDMKNFVDGCTRLLQQLANSSSINTTTTSLLTSSNFPFTSCFNRLSVINTVHKVVATILYKKFVVHTVVAHTPMDSVGSSSSDPLIEAGVTRRKTHKFENTYEASKLNTHFSRFKLQESNTITSTQQSDNVSSFNAKENTGSDCCQ